MNKEKYAEFQKKLEDLLLEYNVTLEPVMNINIRPLPEKVQSVEPVMEVVKEEEVKS